MTIITFVEIYGGVILILSLAGVLGYMSLSSSVSSITEWIEEKKVHFLLPTLVLMASGIAMIGTAIYETYEVVWKGMAGSF